MKELTQIGNLLPPRAGFDNPQEGRVYLPVVAPTIRDDSRYWFILGYDDKEDRESVRCDGRVLRGEHL